MDIELLQKFCKTLPGTKEDIKWEHDLCFTVAGKMYCVIGLDPPHAYAFKVSDEDFEEISSRDEFIPAPYLARAKWVKVQQPDRVRPKEWQAFVRESHRLVASKLPKKTRAALGID